MVMKATSPESANSLWIESVKKQIEIIDGLDPKQIEILQETLKKARDESAKN